MTLLQQAQQAKNSSYQMLTASTSQKNKALLLMADALIDNTGLILEQNNIDINNAVDNGKNDAFLDRLRLNEKRIIGMADGLKKVAALPDPIGSEDYTKKMPNGLSISKRRVPLGVIGIIYEARPNVTSDAAGLCIKSGNAVLLRGGSDAIYSNITISKALIEAAKNAGLPKGCIQFINDTSREITVEMMRLNGYLDVIIPRGGESLIQSVIQNSTVPVIETGVGICHTYIDSSADVNMASDIVFNAKTTRPAVCNALETLLVERSFFNAHIEDVLNPLIKFGVELRGCEEVLARFPNIKPATEQDWYEEYHDLILAVRVMDDLEQAIDHINKYGSHHSESIITKDYNCAQRFLDAVDSSAVYVNASTRFTDGEEFGLGAEIGISTQKLHARGPMGLNELTTIKYIIRGEGQIRV